MFKGTYTALVTPFRDGVVDVRALEALIGRQIEGGIEGIVPCGTTGESPTLTHEEHMKVVELCVHVVARGCKVIAGTGSNSTHEAISLTQSAERAGADGALLVCPYYNKPPQDGLFTHFHRIAESTELPLILYSIPGRCVVEISAETCARLVQSCDNIVGMKEAGGKVERVNELIAACGPEFVVLCGDDALTLPFMRAGARGVISVASNLLPREVGDMVRAELDGRRDDADRAEATLKPFFQDLLSLMTNPIPIKAALAMKGWIADEFRLPLVPLYGDGRDRLRETLTAGGWL